MKILIQISMTIIFFTAQSFSQDFWHQTNGPTGGYIQALAINSDGDIFAGNFGGGISRSTDNGESWTEVYFSGELSSVTKIAISSEGVLFAVIDFLVRSHKVVLSIDNEDSWTEVHGYKFQIESITISPDGDIFLGTTYSGVIRSTNNGVDWTELNSGLTDLEINALGAVGTDTVFAGTSEVDPIVKTKY